VAVQLWGVYAPDPPAGADWFPGSDKVLHALAFGLPVALIMAADTLRRRNRGLAPRARVLVVTIWLSAAHAVVSELIQGEFYGNRTGDPLDLLADWSGVTIAAMLTGLGVGLSRQQGARRTEMTGDGMSSHG